MLHGIKEKKETFNAKWIILKYSVFIFYLEIHNISHANYPGDKVVLTSRLRSEVLQSTERETKA